MNLAELHRREYGRILASLIRVVRDFALAEDALQEAFATAIERWPTNGIPPNPVAWLMTTARNKAIDQIRRRAWAEDKRNDIAAFATPQEPTDPVPTDSLRLIFTCCHPALAPEAQVALTLRTVCGLSTEEIARAFFVSAATLAQRLVRAQTKIKLAGIPYEIPADDELAERLDAALAVAYLVFNEGYSASFGEDLVRADLCAEAIRLGHDLVELLPDEPEAKGLLALMLLNDSRRATRVDADGALVLLEDQDRSRWDRAKIAEGLSLLDDALRSGAAGTYTVQAAISALHARAPSAEKTDWPQIARLYHALVDLHPSPVVELNRAVAVAMAESIEQGLAQIDRLDLTHYHLFHAARADLLRRLGRNREAAASYRQALNLATNRAERQFLERRLAEVTR